VPPGAPGRPRGELYPARPQQATTRRGGAGREAHDTLDGAPLLPDFRLPVADIFGPQTAGRTSRARFAR